MNQQFLTCKHSKMLKEIGFDEECFGYYDDDKNIWRTRGIQIWATSKNSDYKENSQYCTAPLWQQIEQWLWNEHKIWVKLWRDLAAYPENYFRELEFQVLKLNDADAEELSCSVLLELHFNDPIMAKQEGIKKAIEYLHKKL